MATPAYSGDGYHCRGRGGRRWVHAPEPTGNGWLDRVSAWFDGDNTPQYAGVGQPASRAVLRGTPKYVASPAATAATDAATTSSQTAPSVIVASRT